MYVYAVGNNLFETIMFHTLSAEEVKFTEYGIGMVPWRNGREVIEEEADYVTYLEALTWRPMRCTLLADPDGMVRNVYWSKGPVYKGREWIDPNALYRETMVKKKIERTPYVIFSVTVDLLKIYIAMFSQNVQPLSIAGLKNIISGMDQTSDIEFRVLGTAKATGKATLKGVVSCEIVVPAMLITNAEFMRVFYEDLNLLRSLMRCQTASSLVPESVKTACTQEYCKRAENEYIPDIIDSLIRDETEEHRACVAEILRRAVSTIRELAVSMSDKSYKTGVATKGFVSMIQSTAEREIEAYMPQPVEQG